LFRRDAETSIRNGCAPRNKPNWTISHNKLPPTPRVGLVRPPLTASHRPALILLFAKKFFRSAFAGRMRWTGQIFWLLAYVPASTGITFFPPSPFALAKRLAQLGSRIQLQQRNCSRFSRDFLRRSTFPSSQRTGSRTSGLRFERQDLLISRLTATFLCPRLSLLQT